MITLTATPVSPSRLRGAVLDMAGRYADSSAEAIGYLHRNDEPGYQRTIRAARRRYMALMRLTAALAAR